MAYNMPHPALIDCMRPLGSTGCKIATMSRSTMPTPSSPPMMAATLPMIGPRRCMSRHRRFGSVARRMASAMIAA